MSTIVFTVDCRKLDRQDSQAVKLVCDQEAERRRLSELEPIDFSTPAARKQFYETYMVSMLVAFHAEVVAKAVKADESTSDFKTLRSAWSEATLEQREAALKALTETVPG